MPRKWFLGCGEEGEHGLEGGVAGQGCCNQPTNSAGLSGVTAGSKVHAGGQIRSENWGWRGAEKLTGAPGLQLGQACSGCSFGKQ